MKTAAAFAIALLGLWAVELQAGDLPDRFSYTVMKEGERVGQTVTNVKVEDGICVFESNTAIEFSEFALDVTTRTEMDAETFLARKYSYQGIRSGTLIEGEYTIDGDKIEGWTVEGEYKTPVSRVSAAPGVVLLEDYVISHEVMIANAFAASGDDPATFGLFMPSTRNPTVMQISAASVSAMESDIDDAICTKLVVSISGSSAFASFFDPERGLPVYIAFPSVLVEVFLDDFWGDTPISRYREK